MADQRNAQLTRFEAIGRFGAGCPATPGLCRQTEASSRGRGFSVALAGDPLLLLDCKLLNRSITALNLSEQSQGARGMLPPHLLFITKGGLDDGV